jgi:hypothetical protein
LLVRRAPIAAVRAAAQVGGRDFTRSAVTASDPEQAALASPPAAAEAPTVDGPWATYTPRAGAPARPRPAPPVTAAVGAGAIARHVGRGDSRRAPDTRALAERVLDAAADVLDADAARSGSPATAG